MERAENFDPEGDWFRAAAFRKRDADLISANGKGFRQPPSREQMKHAHREAKRMKERAKLAGRPPIITVLKDPVTGDLVGAAETHELARRMWPDQMEAECLSVEIRFA